MRALFHSTKEPTQKKSPRGGNRAGGPTPDGWAWACSEGQVRNVRQNTRQPEQTQAPTGSEVPTRSALADLSPAWARAVKEARDYRERAQAARQGDAIAEPLGTDTISPQRGSDWRRRAAQARRSYFRRPVDDLIPLATRYEALLRGRETDSVRFLASGARIVSKRGGRVPPPSSVRGECRGFSARSRARAR